MYLICRTFPKSILEKKTTLKSELKEGEHMPKMDIYYGH